MQRTGGQVSERQIAKLVEASALTAWQEAIEERPELQEIFAAKNLFIMGFASGALWAVDALPKLGIS